MALSPKTTDIKTQNKALELGFTDLQSKLLGNRLNLEIEDFFHRHDQTIPSPLQFNQGEEAIEIIYKTMKEEKVIWLVSDFDNDGVGAMAASNYLLTEVMKYPKEKVRIQITKRFDGYGLTKKAIDLMLKDTTEDTRPDLLITMDIGSSNGAEVEYLKEVCPNMNIIITDHHAVPPEGYPKDISAFINPNKPGCNYPDKTICGAAVVFFVLDGVRIKLKNEGLPMEGDPFLALSFVASSTVADAVSMESPLNRFIVKYGVNLMNHGVFPAWNALKEKMEETESITEVTLGWVLGPMINATSRLGKQEIAPFKFFSAKTGVQAFLNLKKMDEVNLERKDIQNRLYKLAREEAELQADNACIIVKLNEKYPGIGGVVAGRLMADYKKPVFVLMPSSPGVLTGSARAPGEYFVLQHLRDLPEGTMIKFGGHKSVAGLSLFEEKFELFKVLMNEEVDKSGITVFQETLYDEVLTGTPTEKLFAEVRELAPFGQGFPQPIFCANGIVTDMENISKKTDAHKRIIFKEAQSGDILRINYFNAPPSFNPDFTSVAYTIGENHFRGRISLQLTFEGA